VSDAVDASAGGGTGGVSDGGGGPDRERAWQIYGKSIPALFWERAERTPGAVAFRHKELGIYEEVTWARYRERVKDLCLGLIELGLERGDRVAIMGDPCPEWFIGDMAVLCAGAISYGIYTTSSVAEVHFQLAHGDASFFIAEDQEYVDKILAAIDRLPAIRRIVVADMRAMFLYRDKRIVSFAAVEALGRQRKAREPDLFGQRIAETRAEDVAVFVYTSGTTGPPKAAMLTHRDLMIGMVWPYLEGYPELTGGTHRIITHLALAHLVERSASLCLPLIADVIPHIGEDIENLRETLYEVQPTFFHAVPRIWEKIASTMLVGIQMSSPLKRAAFRLAMAVGRRHLQRRWDGGRPAQGWSFLYRLAHLLVFRHLLRRAGLSRARSALTAGAPIPERVQALWQIWGVNLRNLYGITEGTLVLCQRGDFPRPGDVGHPLFPKEVRLGEDGEVQVGGPGLFAGYWGNEAATRDVLRDGWLHTGDVAERTAAGGLRIVDRKKDLMVTAGGKNITPSEIENLLKGSPYISEAVVFADGRKYVTALIEIDFETVSEWARQAKILYTGYTSLAHHPRVHELIAGEVARGNEQLARVEQIKKFRILPKELDPEEGDTTPTRKIKRRHLYDMFRGLVEEMYSAEEEALIAAELKDVGVPA
jgi:long-chain acyl-CoA synthetase